jgi:ribosomal protein S30
MTVSKATRRSRPLEVSSRAPTPVGALTKIFCPKVKARDPRMDGVSSGDFNAAKCAQAYDFIDELRRAEKKALSARTDEDAKATLRMMDSQDKQRQRLGDMQTAKATLRTSEGAKVAESGKKPFFHNKQIIKKTMLAQKYDSLTKQGKIDSAIAKKRRHEDAKEKKNFVPRVRRTAEK